MPAARVRMAHRQAVDNAWGRRVGAAAVLGAAPDVAPAVELPPVEERLAARHVRPRQQRAPAIGAHRQHLQPHPTAREHLLEPPVRQAPVDPVLAVRAAEPRRLHQPLPHPVAVQVWPLHRCPPRDRLDPVALELVAGIQVREQLPRQRARRRNPVVRLRGGGRGAEHGEWQRQNQRADVHGERRREGGGCLAAK